MKNVVICDLDGTIAKVGDRIKYLQQEPKDWDSFYNDSFDDEPFMDMVTLVRSLHNCLGFNYKIAYCTGRREKCREKTMAWIEKYHLPHVYADNHTFVKLLMRKDDDFRPDAIIKPELVREAGIDFNDIAFVLEDRNCVVKAWRELGVRVLQVAEGDF